MRGFLSPAVQPAPLLCSSLPQLLSSLPSVHTTAAFPPSLSTSTQHPPHPPPTPPKKRSEEKKGVGWGLKGEREAIVRQLLCVGLITLFLPTAMSWPRKIRPGKNKYPGTHKPNNTATVRVYVSYKGMYSPPLPRKRFGPHTLLPSPHPLSVWSGEIWPPHHSLV